MVNQKDGKRRINNDKTIAIQKNSNKETALERSVDKLLGGGGWGLSKFYSCETSSLILMQHKLELSDDLTIAPLQRYKRRNTHSVEIF